MKFTEPFVPESPDAWLHYVCVGNDSSQFPLAKGKYNGISSRSMATPSLHQGIYKRMERKNKGEYLCGVSNTSRVFRN
jgi:hypothetical protein